MDKALEVVDHLGTKYIDYLHFKAMFSPLLVVMVIGVGFVLAGCTIKKVFED